MAVRVNVTAVRDCPPDEVRAVMSEVIRPGCANTEECRPVGELPSLREQNGWTWFTTSVWGVSASDLNRGLCRLARPALQFTTSDGDRWYVTIHGGPTGQVHFLHEFWTHRRDPDPAKDAARQAELESQEAPTIDPELAFLEDDPPPGSDRPRVPFDLCADELAETGVPVPEEFRASVAALPYSQAVARYRRWHAEQVSIAVRAAGIPHDADAVRSVLLWENVTDREIDSDIGNLPRLLSVLGLGGEWDEYVQQVEAPLPEGGGNECAAEAAPAPADLARQVLDRVEALPLVPIEGQPVPLAPSQLVRVGFASEACSTWPSPTMAVRVSLPEDVDRHRLLMSAQSSERVQVMPTTDGFCVGLLNRMWFNKRDLQAGLGSAVARLLLKPPEGTVLETGFAVADEPATYQRYRGTVRDGVWWIDQTYPRLSHEALAGAIEASAYESNATIRCRNEAEAIALETAARHDADLYKTVQRKGQVVSVEFDTGNLARLLFRLRHHDAWDFRPIEAYKAQKYQERIDWEKQIRGAAVKAARNRAAPHDDEILLRGEQSIYWRSDFTQLTQLEQETREKIDQAMSGLGFQHSGDLVAKKQRDIVLRAYASGDGLSYGILMGKRTMYLGYEFFSRFANGSTLTTTTNYAVDSDPQAGIYYKTCPGLEVPALFEKHRWGLDRFRAHKGTEPVPLDGTLLGVARELDAAFARRATVDS
jgi:hypothetical protein